MMERVIEMKFKKILTINIDESKLDSGYLKKIVKYKNCITYPPIAYVSKEARIAKQEIFVGNIENFLKGSPTCTV